MRKPNVSFWCDRGTCLRPLGEPEPYSQSRCSRVWATFVASRVLVVDGNITACRCCFEDQVT